MLNSGLPRLERVAICPLSPASPTATLRTVTGSVGAGTVTGTARQGRLVMSGLEGGGRAKLSCSRTGLVTSVGAHSRALSCWEGREQRAREPRRSSRTESVSWPSLSDIKWSFLVPSGTESK